MNEDKEPTPEEIEDIKLDHLKGDADDAIKAEQEFHEKLAADNDEPDQEGKVSTEEKEESVD